MCGSTGNVEQKTGAFPEPRAQDRMGQVGAGLVEVANRIAPGGVAEAEAGDLGEDEPHPVGPFPAAFQFGEDLVVNRSLGCQEAVEVGSHESRVEGREWAIFADADRKSELAERGQGTVVAPAHAENGAHSQQLIAERLRKVIVGL